ncbi:hypothetical protein K503DRAFT_787748, partial [Rhizopogon vinicolor AM-OR11-026]
MTAKKSNGGSAEWIILPDSCTNANGTVEVADGANGETQMEWEVSDELQHNEGFYVTGEPLLKDWLHISATLEMSLQSQISSASVLFVHLVIVDYDVTGGGFDLAYNYL